MDTLTSAIRELRQAVQELDQPGVFIGKSLDPSGVRWLAQKLGFRLPADYLDLLAHHNGAVLIDTVFFSFVKSLEILLLYHREWADPPRYWPLSTDGCGNYYCLDVTLSTGIDAPVVFFDTMNSALEPDHQAASSIAQFVASRVATQLSRATRQ